MSTIDHSMKISCENDIRQSWDSYTEIWDRLNNVHSNYNHFLFHGDPYDNVENHDTETRSQLDQPWGFIDAVITLLSSTIQNFLQRLLTLGFFYTPVHSMYVYVKHGVHVHKIIISRQRNLLFLSHESNLPFWLKRHNFPGTVWCH